MEEKKTTSLIKNAQSYNVIIENILESKIRFICSKLHNTEWSGIVFWTKTGSFEENNIEFRAHDFLLLDVGDTVSTAFDMTPQVIGYMTKHNLIGSFIGLLHSHHTMSTNFSAVDTNTLLSEGQNSNHFLSIIVNNDRTYSAAVTRKVEIQKVTQETITYKTFDDKEITINNTPNIIESRVEYFPLKIVFDEICAFDDLNNTIKQLVEEKKKLKDISKLETIIDFPSLFENTVSKQVQTVEENKKPTVNEILCFLVSGGDYTQITNFNNWIKYDMEKFLKKKFPSLNAFYSHTLTYIDYVFNDDHALMLETLSQLEKLPNNDYLDIIYTIITNLIYE